MADVLEGTGTTQSTVADSRESLLTAALPDEGVAKPNEAAPNVAASEEKGTETEGQKDETADDGAKAKAEDAKTAEVPEAYEFKVPEGLVLDQNAVDKFTPLAKEFGLTQDNAQKVVDLYAELAQAGVQAQQEAWKGQIQAWRDEIKDDPEFGGQKYDASIKAAQTVIARYGDDKLKAELSSFGVGNMPSLIRMLARAGADMAEDTIRIGTTSTGSALDPARTMFPGMN